MRGVFIGLAEVLQEVRNLLSSTDHTLSNATGAAVLQIINDSLDMLHQIEEEEASLTEEIASLRRRFLAMAVMLEDLTPRFRYEYNNKTHITRRPTLSLALPKTYTLSAQINCSDRLS